MADKIDVLKRVIAVWSERQDIDAVLDLMTDDVIWHYSAVTAPPAIGKAGARAFLEGFRDRVRNPRWRIFRYAECGDALFLEGADEFDTPDGRTVVIPYMGILEFRDGLISGWRDYFDRGVADRGIAGEKLPSYAQALADRAALPGLGAMETA